MGIFGPSKTDQSQNTQLVTMQNQINQLSAAHNALAKNCESWFTFFNKQFFPQFDALVSRVQAGEKLDAQQQAALDGLVKTAVQIQEATTKTEKHEVDSS
jgi:hypothetical protein